MRDISIIISPLGAPEINYNIVEIKFFFIVIVSLKLFAINFFYCH